jgi:hypothetical protein
MGKIWGNGQGESGTEAYQTGPKMEERTRRVKRVFAFRATSILKGVWKKMPPVAAGEADMQVPPSLVPRLWPRKLKMELLRSQTGAWERGIATQYGGKKFSKPATQYAAELP